MKKILLLVLIIGSLVLIQNTQATSGDCSWHGGINCNAGSDWDGSAICNDGWRDSTDIFSQVVACQKAPFTPLCTESESAQLDLKYGVPDLQKQFDEIDAQFKIISAEYNAMPTVIIGAEAQAKSVKGAELMTVIAKENGIRNNLNLAFNQSLSECRALGAVRYQERLRQALQEVEDVKKQSALKQLQTQCSANSTLNDDGKCYCNTGYINSTLGLGCVTPIDWCKETNSIYISETKQCSCSDGYDRLSEGSKCILVTSEFCQTKYGDKSIVDNNGGCRCLNGYGPVDNKCVSLNEYCLKKLGENYRTTENGCNCKQGFSINSEKTNCIKINDTEVTKKNTQEKIDEAATIVFPKKLTQTPATQQKIEKTVIGTTTTEKILSTSTVSQEDKQQPNVSQKSVVNRMTHGIKNFFVNVFKKLKFW